MQNHYKGTLFSEKIKKLWRNALSGKVTYYMCPLQLSRLWHSKEDQVVLEYQVEI